MIFDVWGARGVGDVGGGWIGYHLTCECRGALHRIIHPSLRESGADTAPTEGASSHHRSGTPDRRGIRRLESGSGAGGFAPRFLSPPKGQAAWAFGEQAAQTLR